MDWRNWSDGIAVHISESRGDDCAHEAAIEQWVAWAAEVLTPSYDFNDEGRIEQAVARRHVLINWIEDGYLTEDEYRTALRATRGGQT